MKHIAVCLLTTVVVRVAVCAAPGEVFILAGGGRIAGELLNPDESPRQQFVIKMATGGQVTLAVSQVKQMLQTRPDELEYEKRRPRYPDTVEGQWALAQWCLEHRLRSQRTAHLERVVELETNHVEARRALGYRQVNGRWMTRKEEMTAQGMILYKGRYRTPQEIELMEGRRKNELAEKEWFQKIKRWRGWLGTDRDADGRRSILGIDDPYAVKALATSLEKDPVEQARLLYIEALSRIGTPTADKTLAVTSIEDPVEEVRLTCIDCLEKKKNPDVVTYYVGKLRAKANPVVNLAALGLARMGDPSATGPLIDALVTTHKFKVTKGGGSGSMSSTFGTGPGGSGAPGGGGLAMGGGTKIYNIPFKNQAVLEALIGMTGQNFGYDEKLWKSWYSSQRRQPVLDARRD